MKDKLKTIVKTAIFKDSLIYGLTNALYTGLPILLMPFLIAVLNPADYGKIELFRSITMVLTPIVGLSTVQSITRYYYDLNEEDFKKFTASIIILQLINSVVALIIMYIVSFFIAKEYYILMVLAIIFFVFNQITEALLSIYRVKRQPRNYLIIRIGIVVLDLLLLTILYYTFTKYDWTYRVLPNVVSTTVLGIICLSLLWKKFDIKFQFDYPLLKIAVIFSTPLIIHMISGYILNIGDRFFITYYLGTGELGNYSVAYQIGLIVSFFFTSFNLAWTPTFFEWMEQEKYSAINKVKKVIFVIIPLIGFFSVLGWNILSKSIPNLAKYNVDLKLVVIITLAYIILSFYKFNSNYYFYFKQTKTLATITFVTGIVCVVLYMILIPKMGVMGAAIATLITFILMFISTYIFKPNEKNIEKP
ncbi:lipopolysaccharide biosynthesis protein [Chryseobacterium populi]|uniref:Membrane protein involved in the export of O-antigen and teichoic acid n=1 Tax=Chryseobacterium populi TaxID=1144316 RepID=J2T9V2_9FLAO|nr:oligosaccharide flippase family protein [Chryseobacterium populi]EJL74907.1 membrane protein involved in the export of O-antigen and teichoic acid [Chryseobacterium populi]